MSPRSIEPIHSEPSGDALGGRRDTHPAFGVAVVSRGHVGPPGSTLFQSDLQHREVITLRIHEAERHRDLHTDWTYQRRQIVEVEMSLAQWGALVSSIGLGSGVPVTIRSTMENHTVPGLPFDPRMAESLAETRQAVEDLLAEARKTLADLETAVEAKAGVKAVREALIRHSASLANAESNSVFAVKSLKEAAEKVVAEAKSDIEAHVLNAQRLTGSASIEAPTIQTGALES